MVTGPLLIRSDGAGGVVAGRLAIDSASWQLGRGAAIEQLPNIRTREINRPIDAVAPRGDPTPWRFLIDARGKVRWKHVGAMTDAIVRDELLPALEAAERRR